MKETRVIFISVLFLSLIGIVMIYSASQIWASYKYGNEYFYAIRQGVFFLIGTILFYFAAQINLDLVYKGAIYIWFICLSLLLLVLIPGVGVVRGGARSWIGFGAFSIQPAEFMKVATIIILAKYLPKTKLNNFKEIIGPLFLIFISFFLIMLEPDFGTGIVLVIGGLGMIYVWGVKKKWVGIFFILGVLGVIGIIISEPYRIQRIMGYLDPWSDSLGSGFQTIQSLYAIVPNGLFGRGVFNSRQKYFYLPEPQTDFIFAIIVEELGVIGAIGVMVLFFLIFYNGILIALKQNDSFKMLLAFGIVMMQFSQFFINIGVVIGLLPVTGITLPFLSYGGSSLLINFIMIGLLYNIGKSV